MISGRSSCSRAVGDSPNLDNATLASSGFGASPSARPNTSGVITCRMLAVGRLREMDELRDGRDALRVQDEKHVVAGRGFGRRAGSGRVQDSIGGRERQVHVSLVEVVR